MCIRDRFLCLLLPQAGCACACAFARACVWSWCLLSILFRHDDIGLYSSHFCFPIYGIATINILTCISTYYHLYFYSRLSFLLKHITVIYNVMLRLNLTVFIVYVNKALETSLKSNYFLLWMRRVPVSYTHLDVYKRQGLHLHCYCNPQMVNLYMFGYIII